MKLPDSIPVSAFGHGAQESAPKTLAEVTGSIRNYYTQLKAPYLSSKSHIEALLAAETEKYRACQSDVLLSGTDRRSVSKLKAKEKEIQFEISDMESGLSWASLKLRELDQEMEVKIRLVSERYDVAGQFGPEILNYNHSIGQVQPAAVMNY